MNPSDDLEYQLETLAIRTGHDRTSEGEHSEPIFLTSSFVCDSAADAAAKFSGQIAGNTYSRYTNPTVQAFEKRLAVLDGAERAVRDQLRHGGSPCHVYGLLKSGRPCDLFSRSIWFNHCVI